MSELDYEKRIVDYRASTDVAAVRWRDEVLRLDEKAQKKSFFRFAVADARMAEAVHSIVGLTTDGWPIVMQGNHVVHIERRHGVNGAQDHSMNNPSAQLEFRTRIDGTSVISTVIPDTSRRWILITSARIEKTKCG